MANRNSATASPRPDPPGRFARLPVDILRVIAAQYTFEDRNRASEKGLDGIEVTALNQRLFGSICATACEAVEDVCVHATGAEDVDALISYFEKTPERARVVYGLSIESKAERYDENWLARLTRTFPCINLLQLMVNLEPTVITPELVAHGCIQRLSIQAPMRVRHAQSCHWGGPLPSQLLDWRSPTPELKWDAIELVARAWPQMYALRVASRCSHRPVSSIRRRSGEAIDLTTTASPDMECLLGLYTLFKVTRAVTDFMHEVFAVDTPPDIFDALVSYTGPVFDLAALIQVCPNLQLLDVQCFDSRIENVMSAIAHAPRLRAAELSIDQPPLMSDIQAQLDVVTFQPGLNLWFKGFPRRWSYNIWACVEAYKKRGVNLVFS